MVPVRGHLRVAGWIDRKTMCGFSPADGDALPQALKRVTSRRGAPVIKAAAELQVEHGAFHVVVDRVFLGQADSAVELDRLFGDQPVGIGGKALHRAKIDHQRATGGTGPRPEQGLGGDQRDLEVSAAVLERLEHRQRAVKLLAHFEIFNRHIERGICSAKAVRRDEQMRAAGDLIVEQSGIVAVCDEHGVAFQHILKMQIEQAATAVPQRALGECNATGIGGDKAKGSARADQNMLGHVRIEQAAH